MIMGLRSHYHSTADSLFFGVLVDRSTSCLILKNCLEKVMKLSCSEK